MTTSACKKIFFLLICFSFLKISSQTITTVAGNGTGTYAGDGGQALAASFKNPKDVCFDANANMYISDRLNHRIRKITPAGIVSTFAGTGTTGYTGDGGPATSAQINQPAWIYFDNPSGSLYFSDSYNFAIRKVNALGIISTVAGTGTVASNAGMVLGGQATATALDPPLGGVVIGPGKKLYFGVWKVSLSRILQVDTLGVISQYAGSLYNPEDIMFDPSGNLYVCDGGSYLVKKISPQGVTTNFAGLFMGMQHTGDGGLATAAKIDMPRGITMDASGTVYISCDGERTRAVNSAGIISTFAGGGATLGDGGPATMAAVSANGITIGPDGNFYLADGLSHHSIRKIGLTSMNIGIKESTEKNKVFQIYPNPAHAALNFAATYLEAKALTVEITDITGKQVLLAQTNNLNTLQVNLTGLKPGVYYATVSGSDIKITEKFIKE